MISQEKRIVVLKKNAAGSSQISTMALFFAHTKPIRGGGGIKNSDMHQRWRDFFCKWKRKEEMGWWVVGICTDEQLTILVEPWDDSILSHVNPLLWDDQPSPKHPREKAAATLRVCSAAAAAEDEVLSRRRCAFVRDLSTYFQSGYLRSGIHEKSTRNPFSETGKLWSVSRAMVYSIFGGWRALSGQSPHPSHPPHISYGMGIS